MTFKRQGAVTPAGQDDDDDGDGLVFTQYAASQAGFYRTCRLPRCRRARRCAGCRWPGGDAGEIPDAETYPPCIMTAEDLGRLIAGLAAARAQMDAILARPMRDEDDSDDGEDEPIVWPLPEGLPRRRRRGRHGRRRARASKALTTGQETPSDSAEIQNTASCDSAVSSQTKSRCGNSSSRTSRPEPISQIMPPSGLR